MEENKQYKSVEDTIKYETARVQDLTIMVEQKFKEVGMQNDVFV